MLHQQTPIDLKAHLAETGEEEYQQLVSLLGDDFESFALYIIRSDFDTLTRNALLDRLKTEIGPVVMRTVSLSPEHFDVLESIGQLNAELNEPAVIAVLGLEETPLIFATSQELPQRPPALALLNHGREVIRRVHHPIIFWCDPTAYSALREHAPDFFDHYTGLFTFMDAVPHSIDSVLTSQPIFDSSLMMGGQPRLLSAISPHPISPTAKQFYEEQVERFSGTTLERARALLGLAHALFSLPEDSFLLQADRVEAVLREALMIYNRHGVLVDAARAHAMLASFINRKMRSLKLDIPELRAEMNDHAQAALETFSEHETPVEWAAMQWFLAALDEERPRDEDFLRRAIVHLKAALRVYTKHIQPYFWASINMNLGEIYSQLPYSSGNNKRAILYLQQALEIYDEATYSHEFGLVQILLGKAYQISAKHKDNKNEQSKLIRRAISCYEAASHSFGRKQELNEIILSFTLAALAWQELPTGNKREHLRRSADYFLQSTTLLDRTSDGSMQAALYEMAGNSLLKLATLTRMSNEVTESLKAFDIARQIYEKTGQKEQAAKMVQSVKELEKFLEGCYQRLND